MTVDAVNRGTAQALLSNEKIVPITHWFDATKGASAVQPRPFAVFAGQMMTAGSALS